MKNERVTEFCPFCEQEVELLAIKMKRQTCPNCGAMIRPCCMCDLDIEKCICKN